MTDRPDISRAWANNGSVVKPDDAKIDTGWVAEKPPYQTENWVQNRTDVYLQHLDERGVPEWSADVTYRRDSMVMYGDLVWVSLQGPNTNHTPALGGGWWTTLRELANPPGIIQLYGGNGAPAGWLACNGAGVSRTTYNRLFGVIGTAYGAGNGSTTFNLPDLRDRVPVGVGGLIPALNGKAGVATTHLGIANLPAHNHAAWTGAAGAHNHQLLDKNNTTPLKWSSQGPDLKHPASQESPGGYRNSGIAIVSSVAGHTHAVGVGNTGSGAGFTNMQPSIGLNFVISV